MNKKLIIQVAVILLGFAGSGYVLYSGLSHNSSPANSVVDPLLGGIASQTTQAGGQSVEKVLPYGDKLDFSILDRQNLQYGVISYPKVDTSTEVGILDANLIELPKAK